jgi:DNA repair protein RadC
MMNIANLGEVTVGYKYNSSLQNRPKITDVKMAHEIIMRMMDMDKIGLQEQIVVLYLNQANLVIGSSNAFTGGLTGSVVDIRIIVATALNLMAVAVLIAHNHPSSNLKASTQDITLTKKLKTALSYMDINLLDHLIVTPENEYLSMSNEGLL